MPNLLTTCVDGVKSLLGKSTPPSSSSPPPPPPPAQRPEVDPLDVIHHGMFGQAGEAPTKRVARGDWEGCKEFKKPRSRVWGLPLSQEAVERMRLGFEPRAMEDKWFVFCENGEGEAKGVERVFFHRSWTGLKSFELEIREGRIEKVWWEGKGRGRKGKDGGTEEEFEEIKETVEELCRWVLGIQLGGEEVS